MRFLLLVAAYFAVTVVATSPHSSPAATIHRREGLTKRLVIDLNGIVNGVTDPLTDGLGLPPVIGGGDGDNGDSNSSSSTPTPPPTSTSAAPTDSSSSDSSSSSSSSSSDSSSSSSSSSTTDDTLPTSTQGIIPPILPTITVTVPPLFPTSSAPASTTALDPTSISDSDTPSSTPLPTTTPDDPLPTTTPDEPASSAASSTLPPDPTTTSSQPPIIPPIITSIIGTLFPTTTPDPPPTSVETTLPPTSIETSAPPPITSIETSAPPPITSIETSAPPPITSIETSAPPPITSIETSLPPPITTLPTTVPTTLPDTTVLPPITFPGNNGSTTAVPTTVDPALTSTSVEPTEAPTSIPIDPNFSFILTASSLAIASLPSTVANPSTTLTDPDQVISTATDASVPTPIATLAAPPLPSGIPARIYPGVPLDSTSDLSSFTLISILFTQELNWQFVVDNELSSGQILAYLPNLIQAALAPLSPDQVKTFCLQVYIPASYRTPSDAVELGTMWLGYIPSNLVDDLAAQIKAKQSRFYTGNSNPVARDLANRVNSGFNLRSVSGTNGNGGGSGLITPQGAPLPNGSADQTGAASDSAKERQDAIIGVVSALGGIALLVLVFLVYRSMKRRRQLKHRRLSDPPQQLEDPFADDAGVRPEGREFDEDSMGAPRRRSFYFAEDSLRAAGVNTSQGAASPVSSGHGHSQMGMAVSGYTQVSQVGNSQVSLSQRRPVLTPGAISAPVLRESSMNW